MSDQGVEAGGEYGNGATGADAFGDSDGVDANYLAAPQSLDGLDRIHARMDEMTAQQQAIVEALQAPGFDYPDGDDEYGGRGDDEDGPTVEELAAELGVEPEDILAVSEAQDSHIIDVIRGAVDRHLSAREQAEDAEEALEDRDLDFEELRDSLPILQDEQACRAIVNRAVALAENWDPRIIDTPAMVGLIELVAKAAIGDRMVGSEQPAGIPRVHLESAQGAAQPPAQPTGDEYWGSRIVAAAQRLRPQI